MKPAIATTAALFALALVPAEASCPFRPGRVVEAVILRCESAAPYLELASAAKPYREIASYTDGKLKWGPVIDLARISEEKYPGTIVVAMLQSELRLVPASTGRGIKHVRPDGGWSAVQEHGRFWWNAPSNFCEPSNRGDTVELWVHRPCCDTLPHMAACLADMDYAGPVPDSVRDRLSGVQE